MESDPQTRTVCSLCGESYSLPEDDVEGNLPRVLLCGHIYCSSCLRPMVHNNAITCPQCEVECTLPDDGVEGLTEDSRIIGLLYTAKMNKKRPNRSSHSTHSRRRGKLLHNHNQQDDDLDHPDDLKKFEQEVDEALVRAAENLAQLENIHQTLETSLIKQVSQERSRLQSEIIQVTSKAIHSIQKWKDVQVERLSLLESHFIKTKAQMQQVEESMRNLQLASQKAREVRRLPSLEKYCPLDKVLETLQAPVDHLFDLNCLSEVSELRCALSSKTFNHSLTLSLDFTDQNHIPRLSPQPEDRSDETSLQKNHLISSPNSKFPSSAGSNPDIALDEGPDMTPDGDLIEDHPDQAQDEGPDVIIEEEIEDGLQYVTVPPTDSQFTSKITKSHKKKFSSTSHIRSVTQWVVVTHILNPNHFYVQYVTEKREGEFLSRKINYFCSKTCSNLCSRHTLDTGSLIFVKFEDGLWHRAKVVKVSQNGFSSPVKSCLVTQISSLQVFFIDSGLTTIITIKSEDRESDALLKAVNNYLRRVTDETRAELDLFAPLAIRCSLKDLIPYDQTKGWTKEAQDEFRSMVNSTAMKMQILGQDKDSLLVDLKKVPVNRASGSYISVREFLVFIEVARFYSPVTPSQKTLFYYPPVTPRNHVELNAVVSHICTPGDFYIQLVDNMESLNLSNKLQTYYNSSLDSEEKKDLHIYCPVIGDACVALFEDKMWYRAQIKGHRGNRKVEVLYVDFGNRGIIPVTDLRKIKDEFFALPAMAIHCCLSDVVPLGGRTWSEACSSRFITLANQKLVTIVATGKGSRHGLIPVKLYESGLNGPLNNIGEQLVNEELAFFRDGSRRHGCTSEDSAIWDPPLGLSSGNFSAAVDELNSTDFKPQLRLPTQLKDVKVRVSHANSPSSFYVQFTEYDSWLKRVCEQLKEECSNREPEDVQWMAGMHCAAHINGTWERAQVCSDDLSNNIAEVIRCDHGNKAKVPISSLLPLPRELEGSLALECTLCDIRPAGGRSTWTATACDFLSFYLNGASAILTAKEVSEERPVPVTLSCSNTSGKFVSIADSLISQGLALRERKPQSKVVHTNSENLQEAEDVQIKTPPTGQDDDENCSRSTPSSCSAPCFPVTEATSSKPPCIASSLTTLSGPFTPSVSGSTSLQSSTRPKPSQRTFSATEIVKTQLYEPPELPCPGNLRMTVSAVGENGTIYARTPNAERQVKQLKKRIQKSIMFNPCLKKYTWKTVQGCVIYGPDTLWYRGQRLEVLGGDIKVQYIDYGNVETIPVVHVQPLLLFENIPQLCVPCRLNAVSPVGGHWQRDAVALLTELLLKRSVDVHILELPVNPREPLTVNIFLDGISVSRIMSENNHCSLDQVSMPYSELSNVSSPALLDDWDINTEGLLKEKILPGSFLRPELPPAGQNFPVSVKHLWTPNELFLWPLEAVSNVEINGETLDEALDRINAAVESLPRMDCFPRGGPCLAEYSDGKYYRAKIMDIKSVEPVLVLVQHVDYGSDDTLPTNKLRQIPLELLLFPTRALKVKVAGFKAPLVNRDEDMLPYSPVWSVRAAMDMIDLLHGCISATVVTQEPELTVHLYTEDGEPVHMPLISSGLAELD